MSNQLQISGAAKIRSIQGPVVANSGVITALDGDASQYVRGDGTLADFPTSTGGGSSVSYYLNTSVSQGTIGGVAYKQLSKVPIAGAGTDVTISANGYIASYLTDANDPALLEVPAGNFNCEFYFSVNSNAHNPYVYAEVYKYDGTTFTLLGSSQSVPEYLTNGTTLSPYYFAIPVATSVLTITDRIAIRIYVNVDGRTVTLHTENNHLCQVVTTFSKGLTTLNSLTRQVQFFQTGTSGTDFAISSSVATHTFNLPVASAANTGKLSSTDWSTFNGKVPYTGANANVDLGVNSLFAYDLYANGNGTNNANLYLKQGTSSLLIVNGYSNILATGTKIGFQVATSAIAAYYADLQFSSLTAQRTYTLPDASGTIALTSNLSSYVPYTGATANVDLGLNNLTANNVFGETSLNVKVLPSGSVYSTGYATLSSLAGKFTMAQEATVGNLKAFTFDFSAWASNSSYTYTLPAASGTIALTSNLTAYLPLSGGTLSGLLNISTASYLTSRLKLINTATGGNSWSLSSGNANNSINDGLFTIINETLSKNIFVLGPTGKLDIGADLGTINPSFALSVYDTNPVLRVFDLAGNNSNINLQATNTEAYIRAGYATTAIPLIFQTGNTTRLTIAATGESTFTGALNGTSAVFSSTVQASAYRLTGMTGGSGALYWTSDRVTLANYNATGLVQIEANGGTSVAVFGGATYNSDFVGTGRFTGALTGTSASFSSSVTAGSLIVNQASTAADIILKFAIAGTPKWLVGLTNDIVDDNFTIYQDGAGGGNRFTINTSGNLGIGIATPVGKLQVYKNGLNAVIGKMSDANILIDSADYGVNNYTSQIAFGYFSGTFTYAPVAIGFISTSGSGAGRGDLTFRTRDTTTDVAPTERMRITSGGQVQIKQSANSHNEGLSLINTGNQVWNLVNGGDANFYFGYQGASKANISPTTGVYTPLSDVNKKKDFEQSTIGLSAILGLKPTLYRMKEDENTSEKHLGFIAQEVKEFIPQAYVESINNENTFIGLDYQAITSALVKAIQELSKQNEELSNRLIKLESK